MEGGKGVSGPFVPPQRVTEVAWCAADGAYLLAAAAGQHVAVFSLER